eukprot:jgi/Chlat1/3376/Chrsp23S03808
MEEKEATKGKKKAEEEEAEDVEDDEEDVEEEEAEGEEGEEEEEGDEEEGEEEEGEEEEEEGDEEEEEEAEGEEEEEEGVEEEDDEEGDEEGDEEEEDEEEEEEEQAPPAKKRQALPAKGNGQRAAHVDVHASSEKGKPPKRQPRASASKPPSARKRSRNEDEAGADTVAGLSGDEVDPHLIIPGGRRARRTRPTAVRYEFTGNESDDDD